MVDELVHTRRNEIKRAKFNTAGSNGDYLSVLLQNPTYKDTIMLRDILVTLLFAGHDNSQNALVWSLYALSHHPQWIDKMRKEAMEHNEKGHELHYADLSVC